jgi:Tfp pilus assembly protein PilF
MLAEAEQNFTKALELDPKYAQALQLRGFLRHGAGWHREALEDLRAALQLEPHNKVRAVLHLCLCVWVSE